MPSRNYELFADAIINQKQIVCSVGGYHRELCPIILGHTNGKEMALTFQFAGQSSTVLPPGGDWRCITLAQVTDIELRDGAWRTGDSHKLRQGCVKDVDLDINPDSPYNPRHPIKPKKNRSSRKPRGER